MSGAECPDELEYAALSYCWGRQAAETLLMLTRSTAYSLQQESQVDSLPKTFMEAMQIVLKLGIHYLWIDRLCILQDSMQDWQAEAATMTDVYKNAKITIAALGARDSDGGCFVMRDPARVAPTTARVKITEDSEEVILRSLHDKPWFPDLMFRSEPLVQRGWVVQERVLAARTLYFGSQ